MSVIYVESQWHVEAVSKANYNGTKDYGLMQLNSQYIPIFVSEYHIYAERFNWRNPYHNVAVGVSLLRDLYLEFGDWEKAVMAYNCGPWSVWDGKVPKSTVIYARKVMERASLQAVHTQLRFPSKL